MPLIIGAKSASAATGVANSCRFNLGDDPVMEKSLGTPTSTKIFTVSAWVKAMSDASTDTCVAGGYVSSSDVWNLQFGSSKIQLTGTGNLDLATTQLFRDPSAWWHICMAVDTSQATDTNRVKLYVNGTQITSFSTTTYPTQDDVPAWCSSSGTLYVGNGRTSGALSKPFDGYIAEFCFVDGQQLAPTSFGEFDSDSPTIWKPIDVSGLTFGDNGFYLDFEDSADLGADVSGNSNDFTATNLDATDQATDTPTNNFATWNPLIYGASSLTMAEGNNAITAVADTSYYSIYGTIPVSTGKWYWEMKAVNVDSASNRMSWGIGDVANLQNASPGEVGDKSNSWTWDSAGGYKTGGSGGQESSDYLSYATGDILSFALDCDNAKLYLGKNGTWQKSGDPTSGATGTGAISITADLTYAPGGNMRYASNQAAINFGGSPGFTVSSGNADAAGYGNFEYAPPSGYYALCTKNLGAYGG